MGRGENRKQIWHTLEMGSGEALLVGLQVCNTKENRYLPVPKSSDGSLRLKLTPPSFKMGFPPV